MAMDLTLLLLKSIQLVQAQAQSRRALAEPRKKFHRYKVRYALLALEKAHADIQKVVEKAG